MEQITLQQMDRALLHKYYQGFAADADLYMDAGLFREYVYDPERVDAYYDRLQAQRDRVDYLIMLGEAPVGEIALKHIDSEKKTCELSVHLQNDSVKNRGYGTRAELLAIGHAFRGIGMKEILADAVLKNKRSQHVLEKVGFREMDRDDMFVHYRLTCEREDL